MDRFWQHIEELVAGVVAEGLAGPASTEDLDAVGVPDAWRGLWGRHDGQTHAVGNLFLGYWFQPLRGRVDSAESDAEQVPDGYLPIAKDFGGAYLVLDTQSGTVRELTDDGETVIVATSPEELLERVLTDLRRSAPRRWVAGEDGVRVPEGHEKVVVTDLGNWAVGETRDLPGGLVVVRIRTPDPAPFPQHGTRVDFEVDHPEDAAATGRLVSTKLLTNTGPEGTGSDAVAGVGSRGDEHWIEATGPIPHDASLQLVIDRNAPIGGRRPLLWLRAREATAERARAKLLLGDPGGALADLEQAKPPDAALAAECALATGDHDNARRWAEQLPAGHTLRLRVFLERQPERALADAHELVAREPADGAGYVWRADIAERLGDFASASRDTEEAIARLTLPRPQALPGLKAALRRRRARIAAPKASSPILEDPTEDFVIGNVVAVEGWGTDWSAEVHVTPDEAATGRLVEFLFPDGDRGAVRLPRGAGQGVRSTFQIGAEARVVHVVVHVDAPRDWSSSGDNVGLAFERWDVTTEVPAWKAKVEVTGLDGENITAAWPKGEVEVVIEGSGLHRADGTRGSLRIRVARS